MCPREFWRATAAELFYLARGARWRERRTWEKLAWLTGYVISPHVKKAPSIARMLAFLGPEEGVAAAVRDTPDDIPAFLEGLAREHKKKFWAALPDKFAGDGDKEK
jgi:hypothetical protein